MAPISAYTMEKVAKTYPRALVLPIIYTPTTVIGASPETLYKKLLEGNDPETGKPVIQEIIEVLTKPQQKKKPEPAPAPPSARRRRPDRTVRCARPARTASRWYS